MPLLLPPLSDLLDAVRVVRLPLRVRFRGVVEREAVLVHGPTGWGEFAPFLEYEDAEAARWLASAIDAAWHADAWPAPVRAEVPVNATVPAVPADDVAGVLARFEGCTTAKVKVAEPGQSLDDDVARVRAVREVLGADAKIRVDANGGWDVADAVAALRALAPAGLEYAEQPCRDVEGLRELRVRLARAGVDVPVAADESVRKADDPLRVVLADAADVVVVKVAPLGGVRAAYEVATTLGEQHGVPVVVSSALDTSVGIAAGVALAAALPELPFACGLGTVSLLGADVAVDPLVPRRGALPATVPAVEAAAFAALEPPPDRVRWWRERVARCHAVLAGASPASS